MTKERYIGIMSGTSLDGIDVVLCEIRNNECELISALEYPIPATLKSDILHLIKHPSTLTEVGQIDNRLGLLFTQAVGALLIREDIEASTVMAIGLHGQTLWHEPTGTYPFTMQLGDANIIASKIGIPVVSDFRRKDIALGGQGAPFAPAFHAFIFSNINASLSVLNIGGMANITVLGEPLIGYDTGCGNVLLDMWIHKHRNVSYDKDGTWAKSGEVDYALLGVMMADEYFALDYPKSTGREKFNEEWLKEMIKRRDRAMSLPSGTKEKTMVSKDRHMGLSLRDVDVQRTLLELTALSISNEVLKFNTDVALLCGGGAKNRFLVERIKALMPNVEVAIAQNADEIEAMTFAWLAYKRMHEEMVNLKDVTGASANSVLGCVYV